jgi:hypothetical protein
MRSHLLCVMMAVVPTAAAGACSRQSPAPDTSAGDRPAVEQPTGADLRTYDETANGIPVTARYPATMQVAGTGSGEGVGVFFTFEPRGSALDDAQVHVFLPSGATSAAELEPFVTGPNGLMANNGWIEDGVHEGGSERFPYDWVQKVIDFSTDEEQSGHVLLGQRHGQAVQVTLLYPSEMADAYWPAATTVLESLEFDGDLLPITSSGL